MSKISIHLRNLFKKCVESILDYISLSIAIKYFHHSFHALCDSKKMDIVSLTLDSLIGQCTTLLVVSF